jgi:hypothetical protein
LIQTWRDSRAGQALPTRSSLSPIDLGWVLPQVFLLGDQDQEPMFRLCGGLVADLFGRDLASEPFLALWPLSQRGVVKAALTGSVAAGAPAVLSLSATSLEGLELDVEMCLAPLTGPGGAANRTLGLFQPVSMVLDLRGRTLARLSLIETVLATDPPRRSALKLIALNGRRVA